MTLAVDTMLKVPGTVGAVSNLLQLTGATLSLVNAGYAYFRPDTGDSGIYGFLFDIPLADQIKLSAQITDHYVEGNYAIHDHIALEPLRITLTGAISELVYSQTAEERFAQQILDRLQPLGLVNPNAALTPASAALARRVLANANRAIAAYKKTGEILADTQSYMFSKDRLPAKNAQQRAYQTLTGYFYGRNVGTIETPWAKIPNMAIESITFDQDETTRDLTTVSVAFKQIQKTTADLNVVLEIGKAANSGKGVVDKGVNTGEETTGLKLGKGILSFFGFGG
jgi:hypothetical protein